MTRQRIVSFMGWGFAALLLVRSFVPQPPPSPLQPEPLIDGAPVEGQSLVDGAEQPLVEPEASPPPEKPKPAPKPKPKSPPKEDERTVQMRRPQVAANVAKAKEVEKIAARLAPQMAAGAMTCYEARGSRRIPTYDLSISNEDGICVRGAAQLGYKCLTTQKSGEGGRSYADLTDSELEDMNDQLDEFIVVLNACEGGVQ